MTHTLRLLASLTLVALLIAPVHAQDDPEVFYPFSIGAASDQLATAISVEDESAVVVGGYFAGAPDFDPSDETTSLTAAGSFDVFLARYDELGALDWVISLGGLSLELVGGAATTDGGIVIVGQFDGTFDADPDPDSETILTSVGSNDFFVAKYDAEDGGFQWAFGVGGNGVDASNAVAATEDGGVVVVGAFSGAADFDPGDGVTPLISGGGADAFLAEYDADGAFVRAFKIGGSGEDDATGVATGGDGAIAVVGTFEDTVNFDPAGTATATAPSGASNAFVASYNADGTFRWVSALSSEDNNIAGAVTADGDGNVIATGTLRGETTVGTVTLTPEATSELFLAKYDAAGAVQWASSIGGSGGSQASGAAIAATSEGEVVVTGNFQVDFNPDPADQDLTINGVDGLEVLVARYRADGSYRWAFPIAAEGFNQGLGVAVDGDDNAVVVGFFGASKGADFDPSPDNAITLFSRGGADAFVAKYDEDGSVWEPDPISSNETIAETGGAALSAPYPNPVRGRASLALALAQPQHVRVEVFDALGRRVAMLHDGALATGNHPLTLDAADLPSGLYVVRAVGDAFSLSARTTVVQ